MEANTPGAPSGMASPLREAQGLLRSRYKETPALALVTDHARSCGSDPADPFHSQVEPMDGCGVSIAVGVHSALGGPHDAPTPGDLLCAALAACQDSALRLVAHQLGLQILALEVRVTGQVDVRGALGMDAEVPVGFQSMDCNIHLQVPDGTPARLLERLHAAAQRCCVVQQTLQHPPRLSSALHVQGSA